MSGATARMRQTEPDATPNLHFIIATPACGTLIGWHDFYLYRS